MTADNYRDADGELDIDALAAQIAPRLAEEHGNWPSVEDRAAFIADWLRENNIDIDDDSGEIDLLMDEVGDLVPTYTLTAS